ncbi:histidine kinase [Comamonas testosteroni]|uniref:Histidine kinase n=1 Tax=Comamonas testosteroni TaxID=285 RepID=A0A0L7MC10_COMTE|nr:EF-hand domain-containing protein [Comamonas testosteroni]KOC19445.1 histidine kinase [Comamonas testosteroni]KWT73847.1 Calcium-binding EF-hand-containing protein [Comamonas testosteroni]
MNKKNLLNCKVSSFEVVSVVLFSALTLGGGMAFAQSGVGNNKEPARIVQSGSATGVQQAPTAKNSVQAAFERADANRDGQLSAQEARQLPVISQRFEEIDSDRNGQLSRAEFDKGAQQY